jgi:serine/threonine protein kinase
MSSRLSASAGLTTHDAQVFGPARPLERRSSEQGSLECPLPAAPPVPAVATVAVRGVAAKTRREHFEPGEIGSLVGGRFLLGCLLGRGGMASVYAARDLSIGRSVALKILARDYGKDPLIVARFRREAEITVGLRHPNVVEVFDFGSLEHRGEPLTYLAMELLEGESLRRTLKREGTLPWPRARALMLDICAGLEAAHTAGVVHRDLKPSNCFRLDRFGSESVQLVDFGIAKLVGKRSQARLTLANHIVGTPEYMSPEQACGEILDQRSDIYAAALILGEMLTGSLPFEAATPSAMLAAHIYEPLDSLAPEGVEFPAELAAIHARALSKNPAQRYPDIASFAAALRDVETRRPRRIFDFFARAFTTRR